MFTNSWHKGQAPIWETLVKPVKPLRYLEIGSYEGQSVKWVLDSFPECTAICIDSWSGEGQATDKDAYINEVENRFDLNMSSYSDRVKKIKSTSFQALKKLDEEFDLIYIDGSHLSHHVLEDAVQSFALLKKNGMLIFDDFGWKGYEEEWKNPNLAINAFCSIYRELIRVVSIGWQVFIIKL